ncbi:phosphoserine phosphatase [Psychromonas marina]|uniref:Phosphoserine phosphatase n=1 Tax=Psychromonas marina TaxID=88364 RepID=A0ABQ6E398_9GAMM|nr:phosphoserine phosphatase SerB [Psychromonas marina]GLS91665.1 phosphoserine phosphatase [Psychromonas marina]
MKTIQKLQIPSKAQPLIEWRDELKHDVTIINHLLFENGQLTQVDDNCFIKKAELIVMGKTFTTEQLFDLLTLLNNQSVDSVLIFSPQIIAGVNSIRLALNAFPASLKATLELFAQHNQLDFALMEKFPNWSKPGLVLMDMDSTTIQIECIDEIARLHGVGEQVSAVTALAMQGKLDFNESLRTRVSKLENMPVSVLKEVADNMPLMPGLETLITGLKSVGWKVAIASGGFNYFADRLKQDHGFDFTIANSLEIQGQHLTGKVVGEIVNADIKARTLNELADKYQIEMSQTVAIGDGANDLVMMAASAMGIAIHAKPIVQEKAAVSLNHLDLEGALAILSVNNCARWS